MRNTWTIIQREYLERVRTRAFLISTVLVPLFMFAAVVLPARFMMSRSGKLQRVVLVTESQDFATAVQRQLANLDRGDESANRFQLTLDVNTSPAERDALRQRVSTRDIDGYIWAPAADIAARKVTYTGRDTSDF